ncbi:MAG: hypothetical protein ABIJ34_01385 [archaeon]
MMDLPEPEPVAQLTLREIMEKYWETFFDYNFNPSGIGSPNFEDGSALRRANSELWDEMIGSFKPDQISDLREFLEAEVSDIYRYFLPSPSVPEHGNAQMIHAQSSYDFERMLDWLVTETQSLNNLVVPLDYASSIRSTGRIDANNLMNLVEVAVSYAAEDMSLAKKFRNLRKKEDEENKVSKLIELYQAYIELGNDLNIRTHNLLEFNRRGILENLSMAIARRNYGPLFHDISFLNEIRIAAREQEEFSMGLPYNLQLHPDYDLSKLLLDILQLEPTREGYLLLFDGDSYAEIAGKYRSMRKEISKTLDAAYKSKFQFGRSTFGRSTYTWFDLQNDKFALASYSGIAKGIEFVIRGAAKLFDEDMPTLGPDRLRALFHAAQYQQRVDFAEVTEKYLEKFTALVSRDHDRNERMQRELGIVSLNYRNFDEYVAQIDREMPNVFPIIQEMVDELHNRVEPSEIAELIALRQYNLEMLHFGMRTDHNENPAGIAHLENGTWAYDDVRETLDALEERNPIIVSVPMAVERFYDKKGNKKRSIRREEAKMDRLVRQPGGVAGLISRIRKERITPELVYDNLLEMAMETQSTVSTYEFGRHYLDTASSFNGALTGINRFDNAIQNLASEVSRLGRKSGEIPMLVFNDTLAERALGRKRYGLFQNFEIYHGPCVPMRGNAVTDVATKIGMFDPTTAENYVGPIKVYGNETRLEKELKATRLQRYGAIARKAFSGVDSRYTIRDMIRDVVADFKGDSLAIMTNMHHAAAAIEEEAQLEIYRIGIRDALGIAPSLSDRLKEGFDAVRNVLRQGFRPLQRAYA